MEKEYRDSCNFNITKLNIISWVTNLGKIHNKKDYEDEKDYTKRLIDGLERYMLLLSDEDEEFLKSQLESNKS
jgi:hypothetical protein